MFVINFIYLFIFSFLTDNQQTEVSLYMVLFRKNVS